MNAEASQPARCTTTAGAATPENPPGENPVTTRKGGRARRLRLATATAAGLLALGVTAAVLPSHPQTLTTPAAAAAPRHANLDAVQLQIGVLNPYTYGQASLGNCYFDVGDRYEGQNGAAVGMATISCPTEHYYRIRVYLDYWYNGGLHTRVENANGTLQYGYKASAITGCAENIYEQYWTTAAQVSIDNGPYTNFYYSPYEPYQAYASCP